FNLLQSDTVENLRPSTSFQLVAFPTLNDGYAIVYANSTNNYTAFDPISDQLTAKAGIYAILLTYNQTKSSQRTILYEMTTPNITFADLHCSVDYVFIGHICTIRALRTILNPPPTVNVTYSNVTTTTVASATTTAAVQVITPVNVTVVNNTAPLNITINPFYFRIRFLSTGSVMSLNPIFNISFDAFELLRNLPHGGYTHVTRQVNITRESLNFSFSLYDEYDKPPSNNWVFPQLPILSNLYGAFLILDNNTMLVALNESTSAWRLLAIDLPLLAPPPRADNGYGNLQISSTYPQLNANGLPLNTDMINVTFFDRISFSNGNLTIYQKIGETNVPRLLINSRTCDSSVCISSNTSISLTIFACIFNDPGGDIRGKLRLTASGSTYFKQLISNSGVDQFFTELIKDLLIIIPTEQGRLDSNKHYQIDSSSPNANQFLISLTIYEMRNGNKKNSTAIKDDLNQLIRNKGVTAISLFGNKTTLLDSEYGFQQAAFSIIFLGKDEFKTWFTKYGRAATSFALLSGTNIDVMLILKSNLMDLELFRAPLSDKAVTSIFWGSCADIILQDIPQFVIQILYVLSSVEYEILPLFALIASGLSTLSNVLSKLFFIKFDTYSPYLSNFYDHHMVGSSSQDEKKSDS
ncbi:29567_t:CDS:2, partial [Racocetra persica]